MKQWNEIDAPTGVYKRIIASLDPDNGVKAPQTITWTGTCPVSVGDEISLRRSKAFDPDFLWHELVASVWIKVTDIVRGKKGEFVASIMVVDHRPRYMKRGGGITTNRRDAIDGADYDQSYAESRAVTARLTASENHSERDSAYRSFREELKDIRNGIGPFADVVLLAELRRVLDQAKAGDLDG